MSGADAITIGRDANGSLLVTGTGHTITIYAERILTVDPAPATDAAEVGPNPYRGLAAFQEEDHKLFFGREALTEKLWMHVAGFFHPATTVRFLAVLGPSGSGKSSVVRAGLLPALARGSLEGVSSLQVVVMTPASNPLATPGPTDPLDTLGHALARIAAPTPTAAAPQTFIEELRRDGSDGLRRIATSLGASAARPLLVVVDQLEEVFTSAGGTDASIAARARFVATLLDAAADPARCVSVIATLRSDFLSETQRYPELSSAIADSHELVLAMNDRELRKAIAEPAKRAGRALDGGTVELLAREVDGHEGGLPLLQFALTRIWEGIQDGKDPLQTLQDLGGVGGALAARAQQIYARLQPAQQTLARRAMLDLVLLGDDGQYTRRRARIGELVMPGESEVDVRAVLAHFAHSTARLVTLSSAMPPISVDVAGNAVEKIEASAADTVEVTHEALFQHWALLRRWLDEGRDALRLRQDLDAASGAWREAGRKVDYLRHLGEPGSVVRLALRDGALRLDAHQAEYWSACEAEEERRRREREAQQRRELSAARAMTRRTRIAAAVLGLAAMIAAFFWQQSTKQRRIADNARQRAIEAARVADSRQLAAQSIQHGDARLDLSLLLGVQAFRTADTFDARAALVRAVQQDPRLERYLHGHEGPVTAVAFHPAGRVLASGDESGAIIVWDVETGRVRWRLASESAEAIRSLAFSPDGSRLAVGSGHLFGMSRQSIVVWYLDASPPSPENVSATTLATGTANGLAFTSDGRWLLAALRYDKAVNVIGMQGAGSPRLRWDGHAGTLERLDLCPDGILATMDDAKPVPTILLWSVADGHQLRKITPGGTPNVLRLDPQGTVLIVGMHDGSIAVWDARAGVVLKPKLEGEAGGVAALAFSADGTILAVGHQDREHRSSIDLWDTREWTRRGSPIRGQVTGVRSLAFSPDGTRLVSGGEDHSLIVRRVELGAGTVRLSHPDSVAGVRFTPDGKTLVTAGGKGGIWTGSDHRIRLWDAATGKLIRELEGHTDSVHSIDVSPDGRMLASGSGDNSVRLWPLAAGAQPRVLGQHQHAVRSVAFSPDGRTLASASDDQTVMIWDVETGRPLHAPLTGWRQAVNSVVFSPDGAQLATGSGPQLLGGVDRLAQNAILLWRVADWSLEHHIRPGHSNAILSLAYSPDGASLVSGSGTTMGEAVPVVQFWDPRSGLPKGEPLRGHVDEVHALAFTRDGGLLVAAGGCSCGSTRTEIRLWDVTTHRPFGGAFHVHDGLVSGVSLSPDGTRLASSSWDHSTLVQDFGTEAWLRHACEMANRDFTPGERVEFSGAASPCPGTIAASAQAFVPDVIAPLPTVEEPPDSAMRWKSIQDLNEPLAKVDCQFFPDTPTFDSLTGVCEQPREDVTQALCTDLRKAGFGRFVIYRLEDILACDADCNCGVRDVPSEVAERTAFAAGLHGALGVDVSVSAGGPDGTTLHVESAEETTAPIEHEIAARHELLAHLGYRHVTITGPKRRSSHDIADVPPLGEGPPRLPVPSYDDGAPFIAAVNDCLGGDAASCAHAGDLLAGPSPLLGILAIPFWARACERGLVRSCIAAANFHHFTDPRHNVVAANVFYEKACALSDFESCAHLGWHYEGAEGCPPNLLRARQMYEIACAAGEDVACGHLGRRLEQDAQSPVPPNQLTPVYFKGCLAGMISTCARLGRTVGRAARIAHPILSIVKRLRAGRPNDWPYANSLGWQELLLRGHFREAESYFRALVARVPPTSATRPFLIANLADARLLLGQTKDAVNLFRSVCRDPKMNSAIRSDLDQFRNLGYPTEGFHDVEKLLSACVPVASPATTPSTASSGNAQSGSAR